MFELLYKDVAKQVCDPLSIRSLLPVALLRVRTVTDSLQPHPFRMRQRVTLRGDFLYKPKTQILSKTELFQDKNNNLSMRRRSHQLLGANNYALGGS